MSITFIIAAVAVLLWAASLVVRRKSTSMGVLLSYIALALIVIAIILHYVCN